MIFQICSVVAVLTGTIKEMLQQHESGVKTRKRNKANQNKKVLTWTHFFFSPTFIIDCVFFSHTLLQALNMLNKRY